MAQRLRRQVIAACSMLDLRLGRRPFLVTSWTRPRVPLARHPVHSTKETQLDYVPVTLNRRDVGTYDTEGSARDLGGLTQEPEPQSQSLLQTESSTVSQQAARPGPRPSTSKHMDPKCKHSGSKDVRPVSSSQNSENWLSAPIDLRDQVAL